MSNPTNAQQALLREIKTRFGGRLSHRIAYDGNVCSTRNPAGKPWLLTVVRGSPFTSELLISYRYRRVSIATNEIDCRIEVRGELATRILSINREEKAGGFRSTFAELRRIGKTQYPVYTENGELSLTQESVLNDDTLAELLVHLELQENEGLHFNNLGIAIYLRRPSFARCISAIEHTLDLIEQIEVTPEQLQLQKLPEEFRPIAPLIKKWAVSDDGEREDLLENSPPEALNDLVNRVEPYLAQIDCYLDSYPNGVPDEVGAALGRLAECVVEAKQRLAKSA